MQGGANDRYKEAVVKIIQKLWADQGMGDLHHGVAELERVHEEHEWRHAHPVLPPKGMPVISSNFYLPRQRGIKSAEACRQHLRRGREVTDDADWVTSRKSACGTSQIGVYF